MNTHAVVVDMLRRIAWKPAGIAASSIAQLDLVILRKVKWLTFSNTKMDVFCIILLILKYSSYLVAGSFNVVKAAMAESFWDGLTDIVI